MEYAEVLIAAGSFLGTTEKFACAIGIPGKAWEHWVLPVAFMKVRRWLWLWWRPSPKPFIHTGIFSAWLSLHYWPWQERAIFHSLKYPGALRKTYTQCPQWMFGNTCHHLYADICVLSKTLANDRTMKLKADLVILLRKLNFLLIKCLFQVIWSQILALDSIHNTTEIMSTLTEAWVTPIRPKGWFGYFTRKAQNESDQVLFHLCLYA